MISVQVIKVKLCSLLNSGDVNIGSRELPAFVLKFSSREIIVLPRARVEPHTDS